MPVGAGKGDVDKWESGGLHYGFTGALGWGWYEVILG
jgi:hypothetical protein